MADLSAGKLTIFVELAGGGAILVGLIFVGLELRQNTAAVETASMQSLTDMSGQYLMFIDSSPDVNRLYIKAAKGLGELDEAEALQLYHLTLSQWLRFQSAFLHWQRGTMSDQDWMAYTKFFCSNLTGIKHQIRVASWDSYKSILVDPFAEFVEACWSDIGESID